MASPNATRSSDSTSDTITLTGIYVLRTLRLILVAEVLGETPPLFGIPNERDVTRRWWHGCWVRRLAGPGRRRAGRVRAGT
jgi:hypothetical protein